MDDITTALKEWAVVQRSLLEGHQIILIRKGGLIEENGEFALQAKRFLLYPTYEHETERLGDVQECFSKWLIEEEEAKPAVGEIRFEAFAEVTDIVKLESRAGLIRLSPTHIWKQQFIDLRFDWEPYKPVFALVLRAYRLPNPWCVPCSPNTGAAAPGSTWPNRYQPKALRPPWPTTSSHAAGSSR